MKCNIIIVLLLSTGSGCCEFKCSQDIFLLRYRSGCEEWVLKGDLGEGEGHLAGGWVRAGWRDI